MRAEQRLSFASEHETDKTGLDREQVRHLPWYRLRVREAACATRPQNLSAPMHEVPGVRKSQKSRGLKQPLLLQAAACNTRLPTKPRPQGIYGRGRSGVGTPVNTGCLGEILAPVLPENIRRITYLSNRRGAVAG
jgi:hypothetical protein